MPSHKRKKKQAKTSDAGRRSDAGGSTFPATGHGDRGNAFRQEQLAASAQGEDEDVRFDGGAEEEEEQDGGDRLNGKGHGNTLKKPLNSASTVHRENPDGKKGKKKAKKTKKAQGDENTVFPGKGPGILKKGTVNANSTIRHSIKGGGKKKGGN